LKFEHETNKVVDPNKHACDSGRWQFIATGSSINNDKAFSCITDEYVE